MSITLRVPPEALRRRCDPADVPFESTADAAEPAVLLGQGRAAEAIAFGIAVPREGYNVFALGPPGIGKRTLVDDLLTLRAREETAPPDWCYVANLAQPHRPRALTLPPGRGTRLKRDMEQAVADLRVGIRSAFDGDEYRTRKQTLANEQKERQEAALHDVRERAKEKGVAVIRTDVGTLLAPLRGEEPLGPAEFQQLSSEEQAKANAEMEKIRAELHGIFERFHEWGHQHHEAEKALDRETAEAAARRVLERLRDGYRDLPDVLAWLVDVERDVVDNAGAFLEAEVEGLEATLKRALHRDETDGSPFRRYEVNVIVDNGGREGAPVVYEDNPTYPNLVGRIDHASQFGALVTDFTLIRPGALHRACGGYLLLDVLAVLKNPFAWDGLKRALRTREIRTESLGQLVGLLSTVSLEPEPIPLARTKVVLMGDRILYYLLAAYDPDFLELFKVMADFEESVDRGPEAHALYARLLGALVKKEGLRALDRGAVARVLEHAARLAEDAEKLSLHMRPIVDLLSETDHHAGAAGRTLATAEDVEAAIDAQLRRAGRLRERLLEEIRRDTLLIATEGAKTGQVNGLSIVPLGEHPFGHPTRITARARMGKGEVVDIEREVELGGPLHSKGVLILEGFLGERYARRSPLSLSASLVFEQSYAGVEGDSASLAELCALISAIGEVPLAQGLAVTGSVNQHGAVQPVGGVNEKVEGFFDVCRERGLTGTQGVVIPTGNVKNLMLRRDVVAAVEEGRFQVYAVAHADEAITLLAGRPAGVRGADGSFEAGSVNAAVEARLAAFAEAARRFVGAGAAGVQPAVPALAAAE